MNQQSSQPQRPVPGQMAYDPASGRTGVVQAVHSPDELLFDHQVDGRVAFLRPERGGVEWTADAATLCHPSPGSSSV